MNQSYLVTQRERAIKLLQDGSIQFNNGKDYNEKFAGFSKYKSGVTALFEYMKQEENQNIVQTVTQKFNEYMSQAEQMKTYLNQFQQQQAKNQNMNMGQQGNMGGQQHNMGQQGQGSYGQPQNQQGSSGKSNQQVIGSEDNDKFRQALSEAIVTAKPNVKFSDVAGQESAKRALNEAVMLPIKFPDFFKGVREPWKGILLYGPPGTGKTFLAKACAAEVDATFFSISSSDLISKYVGESEKLIKQLFAMAREKKPSIIFIDEIDSMVGSRTEGEAESSKRVKTEFLVQMQGVGNDDSGLLVLGATNLPWALDSAIRRRFEKRVFIDLPDYEARLFMLKNSLKSTPCSLSEQDYQILASHTEGYSASDITILVRDASFQPLRKCENARKFKKGADGKFTPCPPSDPDGQEMNFMSIQNNCLAIPPITLNDFKTSLLKCKTSVSQSDVKKHDDWTKEFGIK